MRKISCFKNAFVIYSNQPAASSTAAEKERKVHPRKKLLSLVMALVLCASMFTFAAADGAEKPKKITIFIDDTVVTEPNGQAEFKARWE